MIIFHISKESDWCKATLDDNTGQKVIYEGHNIPSRLLKEVLSTMKIPFRIIPMDEEL